MTLADERVKELGSLSPNRGERALLRCRAAADLIQTGQYEEAREAERAAAARGDLAICY